MIKSAQAGFETVDRQLEQAARTLGRSEWSVFWSVTLPLAWRSVLAGAVLAFCRDSQSLVFVGPDGSLRLWDVARRQEPHDAGYLNRLIEAEVTRLRGIKSLYSDSYYAPDAFWTLYGGDRYRALKAKYDPNAAFPDLYQKCVMRH